MSRVVSWTLTWTSSDGTETETRDFKALIALLARAYVLLSGKGGTATITQTP